MWYTFLMEGGIQRPRPKGDQNTKNTRGKNCPNIWECASVKCSPVSLSTTERGKRDFGGCAGTPKSGWCFSQILRCYFATAGARLQKTDGGNKAESWVDCRLTVPTLTHIETAEDWVGHDSLAAKVTSEAGIQSQRMIHVQTPGVLKGLSLKFQ